MKTIALACFSMVLLTLSGCGSQDRYQVADPPEYLEILEGDFANISRVPTVSNGSNRGRSAEVDGVMYFLPSSVSVYRVTESGYEILPFIPESSIRQMVAGPDGDLWVIDSYARLYSLQNDQWVFEYDIDMESGSVGGMIYDNQDRLIVYGDYNGLWCRATSGEWTLEPGPDSLTIVDGWSSFGQDPVFVDMYSRVYTEGDDGWELSDPLWGNLGGYYPLIEGNNQGWLAVPQLSEKILHLNIGQGWQEYPYNEMIRYLFWLDDDLYATNHGADNLYKWSGTAWETFLSFPWGNAVTCIHSFPANAGQRLFFEKGGTLLFDGTSLAIETPVLGNIKGMVSYENSNHMVLNNGFHYRDGGGDGVWEVVGQPFPNIDYSYHKKMIMEDDQNQLILMGNDHIRIWDGGSSYQEIPLDHGTDGFYSQPGGEVVLLLDDRTIGVWAGGEFNVIGPHDEYSHSINDCLLEDSGQVIIATNDHLRRVGQDESPIVLTFQGWRCRAITRVEQWGLVCGGSGHLVTLDNGRVTNKTPAWALEEGWGMANITELMADWLGGCLAYDSSSQALLRFDGEQWWSENDEWLAWINYGTQFTDNRDGTYFLSDDDVYLLLELEGQ